MKMIIRLFLAGFLVFTASAALAEEKGKIGFSAEVGVDGFFNPEITSFVIDEVHKDSPAEAAGLKSGDKVVAIGECKIPGCDADDAKEMMEVAAGETITLSVISKSGEEKTVAIKTR